MYYNGKSLPPPKIPALKLVTTGEVIIVNGVRYVVKKLEREPSYK